MRNLQRLVRRSTSSNSDGTSGLNRNNLVTLQN